VVRRRRFFHGAPIRGTGDGEYGADAVTKDGVGLTDSDLKDIVWLRPDGGEMSDHDWESGTARSLAVFLNGLGIPDPDERGEPVIDTSFLMYFNAHHEAVAFQVPPAELGTSWEIVVDTRLSTEARAPDGQPGAAPHPVKAGDVLPLDARSTLVLRRAE